MGKLVMTDPKSTHEVWRVLTRIKSEMMKQVENGGPFHFSSRLIKRKNVYQVTFSSPAFDTELEVPANNAALCEKLEAINLLDIATKGGKER